MHADADVHVFLVGRGDAHREMSHVSHFGGVVLFFSRVHIHVIQKRKCSVKSRKVASGYLSSPCLSKNVLPASFTPSSLKLLIESQHQSARGSSPAQSFRCSLGQETTMAEVASTAAAWPSWNVEQMEVEGSGRSYSEGVWD